MLSILAVGLLLAASPRPPLDNPGREWEPLPDPEAHGYPAARLSSLRTTLAAGQTTAMMVVVGGRVVFEYGDTAETSYVASVRKSLLSMLYGKHVAGGAISLEATLDELGIDDTGGLLPSERRATVRDLLTARSGVYHPAANLGDASERAPKRGSVAPGTHFLYNNWDFNALETILERRTGRTLYASFEADLARPVGMQDWITDPALQAKMVRNDTGLSIHPAHHVVLSTRDMARLGQLMLRGGRWDGKQVIPAEWVARTTATTTPAETVARTSSFVDGLGYGYLWWTFDRARPDEPLRGAYTATGAFGQFITVIPALDMVVAHKTAVPPPRNVPPEAYFGTILPQVIGLRAPVTEAGQPSTRAGGGRKR
jgi:CubicO group peptidase (beta-lactamase class C family)